MNRARFGRDALRVFAAHDRPDWFRIRNAGDTAEVRLYDEIGYYGTSASEFADQVSALEVPRIDVRIHSMGGDVFDGVAIYNALRQHDAHITTFVDSIAASIASVIAQAGDDRVIVESGQMMIHNAWGIAIGDAAEMRRYADLLDKQTGNLANIYAARSGRPASDFVELMADDSWLDDAEAVTAGLADRVLIPERRNNDDDQDADAAEVKAARTARIAALLRHAEEITI